MTDPEWADEVVRRWQRRRYRIQQRERAVAELKAALMSALDPILSRLAKWLS